LLLLLLLLVVVVVLVVVAAAALVLVVGVVEFNVVFTQDNKHVGNQILSTIHLTVSTNPDTDHFTSTAHHTPYQGLDKQ
jgi:hypothetical protein